MKKIIVTGGAGFLGSHLSEKLLEDENNEIVCVDNLYTGSMKNIEPLIPNPRFRFFKHDIETPLENETCDEIYNLACPASPPRYQKDPVKTLRTNVIGTMNMLELGKKNNAKVFQASTSEIYGDPEMHPQKESYRGSVNPIGVRSCYDEGKRAAEALCFDYNRMHGLKIKVARIFNTYGPKMDPRDGRVVSNFIVQALAGEDITVYGDGKQTRSFCYFSDLIDGFVRFMDSGDSFLGPVNLGNPGEFTMLELAEKIIKKTGSSSKVVHLPLPSDDPTQRRPDISLAKEKFDWEPKVMLDEGLERTIEFFRAKWCAPNANFRL